MRLIISGGVLAENGATKRIVPDGNVAGCASTAILVAAQTTAAATDPMNGCADCWIMVDLLLGMDRGLRRCQCPLGFRRKAREIGVHSAMWNDMFHTVE
jgi:hypothetical protein